MKAELGDSLEVDLSGLFGLTKIKNEILASEKGWRLIKDDNYTKE